MFTAKEALKKAIDAYKVAGEYEEGDRLLQEVVDKIIDVAGYGETFIVLEHGTPHKDSDYVLLNLELLGYKIKKHACGIEIRWSELGDKYGSI